MKKIQTSFIPIKMIFNAIVIIWNKGTVSLGLNQALSHERVWKTESIDPPPRWR
jgi:hypothetical protein